MECKEVTITELEVGMVCGESIRLPNSILKIEAGDVLNPYTISRLKQLGVQAVKVSTESTTDFEFAVSDSILKKWVPVMNRLFTRIYVNNGEVRDFEKAVMCSLCSECVDEVYEHVNSLEYSSVRIPVCTDISNQTSHHSLVVSALCGIVAMSLGTDVKDAIEAGLLHDIGKAFVSKDILNKTTRLTDSEYEIIKLHPIFGSRYLTYFPQTNNLRLVESVLLHHERFNGSGYPCRIKGSELPQLAQIIAVSDCCDAMCNKRSYSGPMELSKMSRELYKDEGLNPFIVDRLVQRLCSYYKGLGVYLNDGSAGYVIDGNKTKQPTVKIVGDNERIVDLSQSKYSHLRIVDTFIRLYSMDCPALLSRI